MLLHYTDMEQNEMWTTQASSRWRPFNRFKEYMIPMNLYKFRPRSRVHFMLSMQGMHRIHITASMLAFKLLLPFRYISRSFFHEWKYGEESCKHTDRQETQPPPHMNSLRIYEKGKSRNAGFTCHFRLAFVNFLARNICISFIPFTLNQGCFANSRRTLRWLGILDASNAVLPLPRIQLSCRIE